MHNVLAPLHLKGCWVEWGVDGDGEVEGGSGVVMEAGSLLRLESVGVCACVAMDLFPENNLHKCVAAAPGQRSGLPCSPPCGTTPQR